MEARYISGPFIDDINVTEVQFLGQRGDSGGQGPTPTEEYQEVGTDVDLPF